MILWWLLRGRQIVIIGTCIFSRTLAVGLAASAYAGKAHSWIFFFFFFFVTQLGLQDSQISD